MQLKRIVEARKEAVRNNTTKFDNDEGFDVTCFKDSGEKVIFKGRFNENGKVEEVKGPDPLSAKAMYAKGI